ncbi:outer membrane protein assembly factor BamD [Sphingobacterium alkalisoli]|uniref:Outer membrane protein assembly factor BamD n=1 Tax=Sphingobacterium alkalisoli TaxID=1874115 RepID=A0A4U0GQW8_9SPHI|nr:outer membrane protein assembly factor BamD [Sphingobacterium alkalisoli]TJY61273.1 outer membrane protein assembly factor BamD [Sphingobacterium alkalisoli]GGH31272.1 outer membrane protein assembly factor BamD [Sphingobacterium alkalisoli]
MFLNKRIGILTAFLVIIFSFTGCKSKFEKLRNSNNLGMKYQEAVKLYEKGKYSKALILFDDLIQKYRGRAEAEDLYYFMAYTNYRLRDYTSARFHFKRFADTYPGSIRAEECLFMSAYCYYVESPRSNLDQENTRKAIDELQLFIFRYPEAEKAKEAGDLIQNLRDKLEKKAFDNAKLYFNMGLADDYRAAVIALENVLREYPDTKYAEEIEYLMMKSQYLFADNSYPNRQEKRFNEAIDYYNSFVNNYPESKYRSELDGLKASADKKIVFAIRRLDELNKQIEEREKELGITPVQELSETNSTTN